MLKKENWTVSWKSIGITAGLMAGAAILCELLQGLSDNEIYVPLVFVLCVLLVSLLTDGFLCGVAASLASVLAVNYVFTYPYMELNFSISGYPLTFVTMLAVSLSVSGLTTNRKRQEKVRLEAERERMRANLLRAISHDLRTPLTAISGSARTILENETLSPGQRTQLLTGICDDAQWLIRMVENLLSVTRIGLEEARVEKTPEVGEEVIFSAVSKFRQNHPAVTVETRMPEEVLLVPMDPVLIQQVLTNLMENSADHGGADRLEIWLQRRGEVAVFSLLDNGSGVEKERLAQFFGSIFPPTEREDGPGRRNMGIGLSVCLSIVRAHGGSMSGENRPEGGACFSFSLPLHAEQTEPGGNRHESQR